MRPIDATSSSSYRPSVRGSQPAGGPAEPSRTASGDTQAISQRPRIPSLSELIDKVRSKGAAPEGQSYVGTAVNKAVWETDNGTVPREAAFAMGSVEEVWLNDVDAHDEAIDGVISLLKDAKHEICIQTYIFDYASDASKRLLDALAAKQKQNPNFKVHIAYNGDRNPLADGLDDALKRHGVVAKAAGYAGVVDRGSNHSKMYVIDGHTAVVGGDNLDNPAEKDLMIKVRGPIVETFLRDFDQAWAGAASWINGDKTPPTHVRGDAPPPSKPLVPMTLLSKRGVALLAWRYYNNDADQAFLAAMKAAKKEIKIESPNLNDANVWDAIEDATKRGVKVKVILPKGYGGIAPMIDKAPNSDFLKFWAQLPESARGNLELRWYSEDGKTAHDNHTKFLSIDGLWSYVGSQNMDNQSWAFSRETGVGIDSAEQTRRLDAEVFDKDWNSSLKVEPEWVHKVLPKPVRHWGDRFWDWINR